MIAHLQLYLVFVRVILYVLYSNVESGCGIFIMPIYHYKVFYMGKVCISPSIYLMIEDTLDIIGHVIRLSLGRIVIIREVNFTEVI